MGKVITIDGPAASGKTSVSRELAKRLGWHWVSTGAFYRGLAYAANELHLDPNDEKALARLSQDPCWKVEMNDQKTKVIFENIDVTDQIVHEDIGNLASRISHFSGVRKSLLESQRECQRITEGLVAEGRDCGTVVFPDASLKIYLTAHSENRAQRRAVELGLEKDKLAEEQKNRDHQDTNRKNAPLQIPDKAYVLDTSEMDFDEVVSSVEAYVRSHMSL